jgi:pantothenate kinase type III
MDDLNAPSLFYAPVMDIGNTCIKLAWMLTPLTHVQSYTPTEETLTRFNRVPIWYEKHLTMPTCSQAPEVLADWLAHRFECGKQMLCANPENIQAPFKHTIQVSSVSASWHASLKTMQQATLAHGYTLKSHRVGDLLQHFPCDLQGYPIHKLGLDRFIGGIPFVKNLGVHPQAHDRIAAPWIVLGVGTGVTIDVWYPALDTAQGRFLGGMILPGPATLATCLGAVTQTLPHFTPEGFLTPATETPMPPKSLGMYTESCIQQGLHSMFFGGVHHALSQTLHTLTHQGYPCPQGILITGGYGQPVYDMLLHSSLPQKPPLHFVAYWLLSVLSDL